MLFKMLSYRQIYSQQEKAEWILESGIYTKE